jgi:hypothetical protein
VNFSIRRRHCPCAGARSLWSAIRQRGSEPFARSGRVDPTVFGIRTPHGYKHQPTSTLSDAPSLRQEHLGSDERAGGRPPYRAAAYRRPYACGLICSACDGLRQHSWQDRGILPCSRCPRAVRPARRRSADGRRHRQSVTIAASKRSSQAGAARFEQLPSPWSKGSPSMSILLGVSNAASDSVGSRAGVGNVGRGLAVMGESASHPVDFCADAGMTSRLESGKPCANGRPAP